MASMLVLFLQKPSWSVTEWLHHLVMPCHTLSDLLPDLLPSVALIYLYSLGSHSLHGSSCTIPQDLASGQIMSESWLYQHWPCCVGVSECTSRLSRSLASTYTLVHCVKLEAQRQCVCDTQKLSAELMPIDSDLVPMSTDLSMLMTLMR